MGPPRNLHTTPVQTAFHSKHGRAGGAASFGAAGVGGVGAPGNGMYGAGEDPLLMEYKMTGKRAAVEDLKGHVVAFALDSHGSRFLQYQMEMAREEERDALISEVLPHAALLMQDTFGNYVLQNFLEHASKESRRVLADTMRGSMLKLSMQAHGCRVVQRALDLVELDQRDELLEELLCPRGNVFQAARNTHATHVLQKTVSILRRECATAAGTAAGPRPGSVKLMRAVESAIADDVVQLLLHPHAYRLVLNVLGDCDVRRSDAVARAIDSVSESFDALAVDQHGNFMLQHMLDVGGAPLQRVHEYVRTHIVELSQHKFGSHLVEKCFSVANPQRCAELVGELLHPSALPNQLAASRLSPEFASESDAAASQVVLALMTDPYANFVVQKALDRAVGAQRAELTKIVHDSADTLGRFTYGRHILGHVNAMLAAAGGGAFPPGAGAGGGSPGHVHFMRGGGGMPRSMPPRGPLVPPNPRGFYARHPPAPGGGAMGGGAVGGGAVGGGAVGGGAVGGGAAAAAAAATAGMGRRG